MSKPFTFASLWPGPCTSCRNPALSWCLTSGATGSAKWIQKASSRTEQDPALSVPGMGIATSWGAAKEFPLPSLNISAHSRQSHGPGSHCDAPLGDVTEASARVPLHPGPNYCPGLRTPAARESSDTSPIAAVATIDDPTGSPRCAPMRGLCVRSVDTYSFSALGVAAGVAVINSQRVCECAQLLDVLIEEGCRNSSTPADLDGWDLATGDHLVGLGSREHEDAGHLLRCIHLVFHSTSPLSKDDGGLRWRQC